MKKLLIADDDAGIRSLVHMTLEADEFEILEAEDGERALEIARAQQPQMVLLDVMMPGMSGFEVCAALKSDPQTAGITVVMLTAKSGEQDRTQGEAAGADDYFTKPFSPVALLTKVDEVFSSRSGQ
ncbi:MAG: response regulator transcription factor [Actinomycetota bacterium]